MGLLYGIYVGLTGGLFGAILPLFLIYSGITGRYRRHFKERLGLIPRQTLRRMGHGPRIWIHAVSLGEVRVAESIIQALRPLVPGCDIVVSTMTEHGRALAQERFGREVPVVYAPVDFIACFRTAVLRVRPDAVVFLETEIWPAWIAEARRLGIRTGLINGRISVRSINGYLRLRPFFEGVLKQVDSFSMISDEDAARIRSLGAPRHLIQVNGNAKYDLLAKSPDPGFETEMRRTLALGPYDRVVVAGSTRQGEEVFLLDVYRKVLDVYPDTILIIVPRHIDRKSDILRMVQARGLSCQLRTDIGEGKSARTEPVVIINTFGELFRVYSVATLVFCGASLVPLGGQNPLEPAVWGKPILYGPSMEDFLDAKDLLESAQASMPVAGPEELCKKILWLLAHPEEAMELGARARQAVLRHRGSALAHAKVIAGLIGPRKVSRQDG